MKAAIIREHGPADKLEIAEIEKPVAKNNEVLIKVKAFALNRLDLWTRNGSPHLKIPLPHVGSSDFAGIIEEIGSEVADFEIGDRVVINAGISCRECNKCKQGQQSECDKFYMIGEHVHGGAAEYAVVPITNILKIPEHIDFVNAAAAGLTSLTVYRMLVGRAKIKKGETVLVTGAGGGIGTIAVQIAKHYGAYVYALTSTEEKTERLREIGADYILNYRDNPEWGKELWKLTNKHGVDIVIDSVGELIWDQLIRSLAKGGRLVTCGATTGNKGKINLALLFWKQLSILGSTMASDQEFKEAMQLVFDGKVQPVIDKIFKMEEIREAHKHLESGNHIGKIVLTID